MQVSIEKSGEIERKLKISVPADEVGRDIEKGLQKASQHARLPGFRKGKVPPKLVAQHFSAQVTEEVVRDKINDSYHAALKRENLVPAGLVSIEPKPFVAGGDLQYVATIELFPEIPVPSLAGKTIDKPVCEVSNADIDATLAEIRERHLAFSEKSGAAADGDRVTIDFDGEIGGKPFAGGSARDFPFVIGAGAMLPEFDAALRGARAGEQKSASVAFPAEYPSKEVAGKTATFAVTLKKVEQGEALSDEQLAEKLQVKGGAAGMRSEIETNLKRELAERLRAVMRGRVMQALLDAHDIPLPQALVDEEAEQALNSVKAQIAQQKLPPAQAPERKHFEDGARRRVALGLLAGEVIKGRALKVDEAMLRERLEEMGSGYDDAEKFVREVLGAPERRRVIESQLLEEQVVEAMLATAEVKLVQISFKEFMRPDAPDGARA